MDNELRVLIVEDVPTDGELIERTLRKAGVAFTSRCVCTRNTFLRELEDFSPDIVLSDYSMPQFTGMEALELVKELFPSIPLIIVTGSINEDTAVECMKAGAADYLLKEDLKRLGSAVQSVLEKVHIRKEKEQAERERDALFRLHKSTVAAIPSSLLVLDAEMNVVMANRRYLDERGLQASDIVGKNVKDVLPTLVLSQPSLIERIKTIAEHGGQDMVSGAVETSLDMAPKYLNIGICGIEHDADSKREQESRVLLVIDDVTEKRDLQMQRDRLERLDSIGRLAGGVAHDFNNLLTGIIGYTQMLLKRVKDDPKTTRELTQIRDLANRAADLTRHLLAFSRRQTLRPVVLNLNDLVENISKMLRRIIGEDMGFEFLPAADLANVRVDPGQIEQVIMNLAINARDAMPEGGKLTIETANVVLDREYADGHPGVIPGSYVMLAVTDTGCGMDEATQKKIFEPFFTTKSPGQGTGLGLATVYGIMKQHGGNVWVYSEAGTGTTFKVYLPCVAADADKLAAKSEPDIASVGTETILVVEDETSVRDIMTSILEDCGYTVLGAGNSREAKKVFAERGQEVDLLFTDVVLPDLKGPKLYERLSATAPTLKVLYASGYADNGIVRHGVLDKDVPFLQKPFTPEGLAKKVRDVLDGEQSDS